MGPLDNNDLAEESIAAIAFNETILLGSIASAKQTLHS